MLKHVAHLTTVHRPFDTRVFQKECRTLAQAAYRVSLVTTHSQREVVDKVEIIPFPCCSCRAARMSLGAWEMYRVARRLRADLYHFHDPELLPIGVLLKWSTHAKVVYDAHEPYAQQLVGRDWLPRPLRQVAPRVVGWLERRSGGALDAVVCATEYVASSFPCAKTVVIKNYPLLELTASSPGEQQYNPHNHTLIYTGGWSDHRGIHQIVQALDHVQSPQARLTLLGKCTDPYVQEKAKTLPGFAKVDDFGLVPYEKLYAYLRSAAIGLVCNQPKHNYNLALPNKLFEYMSAGLPVIASDFPLWQQIVQDNQCGLLVDPTKPELIAQAIDYLLAHPDKRRQMGENGRRAVFETYNWQVEGKRLIDLYEELFSYAK